MTVATRLCERGLRTGEITVAASHGFGHVCCNGRGVLGSKLVLDGLSKGDRHDPERFSEKRSTSYERRAHRQPKPGTRPASAIPRHHMEAA